MTTPHTAPRAPEAPEAPQQPGTGSFISIPAIIVAALGAATVAIIKPYLEYSTENAVFIAMFISVATTTSTAVYKACVEKITSCYRGRRWTSILLAGLLAGLVACFVGIGGVSGAEVAMGKEPSILAPLPAPSSDPLAASFSPPRSDPDHPILDYYEDVDHDGLGTGKSEQHQLGEQRPGWVDNAGDQCPLQPGPPKNAGCPPPPDPSYYDDVDHDGLGAGPPHPEGKQLPGWVDNNRDQCPVEPGLSKNDGCPAPLVDPPRVDPPVVDPPVVDPPPVDPEGDDANEPAETGSEIPDETSPGGDEPTE